jgi:hypothetical protein
VPDTRYLPRHSEATAAQFAAVRAGLPPSAVVPSGSASGASPAATSAPISIPGSYRQSTPRPPPIRDPPLEEYGIAFDISPGSRLPPPGWEVPPPTAPPPPPPRQHPPPPTAIERGHRLRDIEEASSESSAAGPSTAPQIERKRPRPAHYMGQRTASGSKFREELPLPDDIAQPEERKVCKPTIPHQRSSGSLQEASMSSALRPLRCFD